MAREGGSNSTGIDPSRLRLDHGSAKSNPGSHSRPRVALYSHDTMGLGHLRRNLLIAQSLAESDMQATSLLVTGAYEANFFTLPVGVDCLTLPRLRKDDNGKYVSGHLGISINDLVCLRAESICSAIKVFQPDVFIVDKIPIGAFGELLPTLRFMKQQVGAKCVLGLRDILDTPETVLAEWKASDSHQAIAEFFDEIWIYGDSQVYNPVSEYKWPAENAKKVEYTGYLNQSCRLSESEPANSKPSEKKNANDEQLVVCTVGGGQDGHALAQAFVDGFPDTGTQGVLLTGPFMPDKLLLLLQEKAANRPNLKVIKFSPEADQLISRADRVIAMGGYNTVCSLLSFQKPALLVPRVFPRSEQWIRAQKLKQLGFVDVLHPSELSPAAIAKWISSEAPQPRKASDTIDLNGLTRIEELCRTLIKKTSKNQSRPAEKVL